NRKSPGSLVTDSSHGGVRNSAASSSGSGSGGGAQQPHDAREQWKLRAPGEAHPSRPGAGGSGAGGSGAGGGPDSAGGPADWPGGEAETAETAGEASFWD